MVRGGKKEAKNAAAAEANPEAEERKSRKTVAFSKGILSVVPAKALTAGLSPSKTVTKHHGKDILKKSQRKNRFLFSFPGLLAPVSGGKIGELKDLGTKNPTLYLDFAQGQMKLLGTIVYPKNRYLTLQFSKGGKNVTCEDYFDTMVVFSEAWWIGNKEENPEEVRMEFPRELYEAYHAGYDFKGGAGAPSETKQGVSKVGLNYEEQVSPKTDLEDDLSDSQNNSEDLPKFTPVRHSERTTGKRFNFAEDSSPDDFVGCELDRSQGEEQEGSMESKGEEQAGGKDLLRDYASGDTVHSRPVVIDNENEDAAASTHFSGKVQLSARSVIKRKEPSRRSSLVQTTISTLFKKADKKVEDDDIEEFSSTSKDSDGSDEDWAR